MARVIVLIGGSNVIGALGRTGLGYPALGPLLASVVQNDDLVSARFYGNPPPSEPWAGRCKALMSANRHVARLDWFQGYREKHTREETAVDVAIVTDLFHAHITGRAEKAIIIGGDGDHLHAFHVARAHIPLRVYVVETQPTKMLASMGDSLYHSYCRCDCRCRNLCPVEWRARAGSVCGASMNSAVMRSPRIERLDGDVSARSQAC
jgi:hypothetical protein